jgi:ketosteroid isomerase-like protein
MTKAAVFVLAILAAPESLAQRPSEPVGCAIGGAAKAVCVVEDRLTDALRRNDAPQLAAIYADDFQLINYRGTRITKPALLGALRTGTLRFDSLTTSDLEVRIYDAVAVVTGRQYQIAREPGRDEAAHPADVRFSHVYVRAAERWLLVFSQITPILGPAR